jgi:hypothetical protein
MRGDAQLGKVRGDDLELRVGGMSVLYPMFRVEWRMRRRREGP